MLATLRGNFLERRSLIAFTAAVYHDENRDLVKRLKVALYKAGLAKGYLDSAGLAPFDQFHSCGMAATIELTDELEINATT